jgi:hypothetical protein
VPQAFEFAERFSKLATSNALLLLDDRFLKVAPKDLKTSKGNLAGFEIRQ